MKSHFLLMIKKIDMIQASHRDGDVCIIDARKLYEWLKEHYENN